MTGLAAIGAFIAKDFRTALSYRVGFFLGLFGAFFGLVVTRIVSKLVTGGQFAGSQTAYFKFTVVGLVLAAILEPTAVAGSAAVRQDQVQGTLEYLATLPVSRVVLGISWSAYSVIQSMITACLILAVTIPLGFRVSHVTLWVVVPTLILTLTIFMAIGNFGTAIVLAFQQGGQIVAAGVTALMIMSGMLFPVDQLPRPIAALTRLSPLTYALQALRSALLSGQPHTSYGVDLLVLVAFAVVLVPLSAGLLELAFRHAQRRATFSTF